MDNQGPDAVVVSAITTSGQNHSTPDSISTPRIPVSAKTQYPAQNQQGNYFRNMAVSTTSRCSRDSKRKPRPEVLGGGRRGGWQPFRGYRPRLRDRWRCREQPAMPSRTTTSFLPTSARTYRVTVRLDTGGARLRCASHRRVAHWRPSRSRQPAVPLLICGRPDAWRCSSSASRF
jgi:hypothetical protein